ncbi:hypothetical protein JCM6882_004033 [Rhodosporidiobolus microsporus]
MFSSGAGGRGEAASAANVHHGGGGGGGGTLLGGQHPAGGPAAAQGHYVMYAQPAQGAQYAQQHHQGQPGPPLAAAAPRPPQGNRVGYPLQHHAGGPPPQGQQGQGQGQHVVTQRVYSPAPGGGPSQHPSYGGAGGPATSSPQMAMRQGPPPPSQQQQAYEQQQRFLQQQQRQQQLQQGPPPQTPFSISAPSPAPFAASPAQHQRAPTGQVASSPAAHQRVYHHNPQGQPYPPSSQPSSSSTQPPPQPRPAPPPSQIHHSVEQAIAASLPPSSPARGAPPPLPPHPHHLQQQHPPPPNAAQAHARALQQQQRHLQATRAAAEQQLRAVVAMPQQPQRRGSVEEVVPASAPLQHPGRGAPQGQYLQPGPAGYPPHAQQQQQQQPMLQRRPTGEGPAPDEADQRTIFHGYLLDYLQKAGYHTAAAALLSDIPSIPTHAPSSGRSYPSRTSPPFHPSAVLGPAPSAGAPGAAPSGNGNNPKPLFLTSPSALSPQKLSPQAHGLSPAPTPSPTRATAHPGGGGGEPQNADTVGSTTSTGSSSLSSGAASHFGFEGSGAGGRRGTGGTDDEADGMVGADGEGHEKGGGSMPAARVMMESEEGFLYEWWTVFWDVFRARSNHPAGSSAAARSFVAASTHAAELAMAQQVQQQQQRPLHAQAQGGLGMGMGGMQRRMSNGVVVQLQQPQQAVVRRRPSAVGMNGAPPPHPPQHLTVAPPAGRAALPPRQNSFTTAPPAPSPNGPRRGSLTHQQAQQIQIQQMQQQQQRAQEAAQMAAQQTMHARTSNGAAGPQGQSRMTGRRGAVPPDDSLAFSPPSAQPAPLPRSQPSQAALAAQQREQYERQQLQHAQAMPMALPQSGVGKGRQQQQLVVGGMVGTPPQVQGESPAAGASPQKSGLTTTTPPFQRGVLAYTPGELQQADEARAAYRAKLVASQQSQMASAMELQRSRSRSQGLTPMGASPPMGLPLPVPEGEKYLLGADGKRAGAAEAEMELEGVMAPPLTSSAIVAGRRGALSQANTPTSSTVPLPQSAASPNKASGDGGMGSPAAAVGGKRRRPSLTSSVSETREAKKRAIRRPGSSSGPSQQQQQEAQPQSTTASSAAPTTSSSTPLASGLVDISESPGPLSVPLDISLSGSGSGLAGSSAAGAVPVPDFSSLDDTTTAFLQSFGASAGDAASGVGAALDFGMGEDGTGEQVSLADLEAFLSSTTSATLPKSSFTDHASTMDLNNSGAEFDYDEFLSGFGGGDGGAGSYDPTTAFDLAV